MFDTQEKNEIRRRVAQVRSNKRDANVDLQKATETFSTQRRKFQESKGRDGQYPAGASDSFAKSLREVQLCEQVLRELGSATEKQEVA